MNKFKSLVCILLLSASTGAFAQGDVASAVKTSAKAVAHVSKHVAIDTVKVAGTTAKDVVVAVVYLGYGAVKGTVAVGKQIKHGIDSEKHKK